MHRSVLRRPLQIQKLALTFIYRAMAYFTPSKIVKLQEISKTGTGSGDFTLLIINEAVRLQKKVICPGISESFFRGRRTVFSLALTSSSLDSRFLRISAARLTTSRGRPAIAPT